MKRNTSMSRTKVFTLYLAGFLCLILIGFISQLKLFNPVLSACTIVASAALFDRYVVELIFVLTIGIWLINGKWYFRAACYLLSSLFIIIYALQLSAYYQGGEFISRLAIENANHLSLLLNTSSIIGIVILLGICGCLILFVEKKYRMRSSKKQLIAISVVFSFLGVFLHNSPSWLPESVLSQRKTYYIENNLTRTPPIRKLYKTLFSKDESAITSSILNKYDLKDAKSLGFNLKLGEKYPLIKENIYKGPPPFKSLSNISKKPNIVVFFTEGLSARTINCFGSKYSGLTPNIDDFAKHSMSVRNYYNHTAATYRGLLGQLCSIYPKYGGKGGWQTDYKNIPKPAYLSLNNILSNRGYHTVFLDAHRKDKAFIDEMMAHLGFDQIWTAETLSDAFLNDAKPLRKDALSDVQLYESLIGLLEKRLELPADTPFFIGMYNLGTHAWQNISADGKPYGNGKNRTLNTIHTLDYSFGKFWKYYQNSRYSKDTVVIFTTDHCHYPEKTFVEAFSGPDYQRIFVDRIPLIIHDPTRELPSTFDAKYATSIDFTPSLIHYLGIPNQKNPFIGASFFSAHRKKNGISSYGNEYFLIEPEKIHHFHSSKSYQRELRLINKLIVTTQKLEVEDRIWNHGFDK